jgi:hypothetical protein
MLLGHVVHHPPEINPRKRKEKRENILQLLARSLSSLGGLLGKQVLVNVWKNTTLGDGDVTQKLVQLLIVTDGELKVTRDNTSLLVVTSGITGQFENFGSKVFKDGSEVNGSTSTNTLGIVTLAKETVNTSNRERETGLGRTRLRVLAAAGLASRFASSHFGRLLGY